MRYRSSNARGWTHHLGDLVAQVDSSHGVQLSGGSTGGVVEAAGDDDNITLTIRGKGTGAVVLGNSSSPVDLNSTTVRIGEDSTTPIALVQRYTVQFTEPDSPASTYVDSTYTVAGATTNANYVFTPRLILAAGYTIGDVRCSTADEITIRWAHNGGSTASGSSNRGTLLQFGY